jgi:uncharacterized repeat protein (TIGR01451 family)
MKRVSHWPNQAASLFVITVLCALAFWLQSASASENEQGDVRLWYDVDEELISTIYPRNLEPDAYRALRVALGNLQDLLSGAPLEFTPESYITDRILVLPLPNGADERFRIFRSPVMAPTLAAKYSDIQTFTAIGVDDPLAYGRLDLTPAGFHAMILSPSGTFFIDPYSRENDGYYISYYKQEYSLPEGQKFIELGPEGDPVYYEPVSVLQVGENLRTYRLALATTGEYSIFHGGTVPSVMAELVTAVNRVTGIYEREAAVRMELIANNDLLIFLDPNTDPYTNDSGSTMLTQNQTTIDNVIGSANYDIGHVFSTGGGGIARLRAVCDNSAKARGVTGLPSPVNDPFYVDYVAHEMGHQYGGNHTFNGNAGSCAGNRWGPAAYEPGSGTTIMAYAGICGDQNIQSNSDDYFHTKSFDEIIAYTTSGNGSLCGSVTSTSNSPPTSDAGTGGFTIPMQTPFTLTGSALDPDSDPMTYNWEEYDLGPAGAPDSPSGNAPIFRSFPSKSVPIRIFPQISDIVNNTHTIGEILPTYARNLTFRLTARDNHVYPSAGGVSYDTISFAVTDEAGPFRVLEPNTAVEWVAGTPEIVTWDVANSDASPVSCSEVDIMLSTDGGYTYPTAVLTAVPNDGSQGIIVPEMPSSSTRILVRCSDSIFFDISDEDFSIVELPPFAYLEAVKSVEPLGSIALGDSITYTIEISNTGNTTSTMTISDTFSAALLYPSCNGSPGDLLDQQEIAVGDSAFYSCSAQVDPSLSVEISKQVDNSNPPLGTPITFTITITNPHPSITLENVVVDDPDVVTCTPGLSDPVELLPLESLTYVCPDVLADQDFVNSAVVKAEIAILNSASVSAPQDTASPIETNKVENTAMITNTASISVTIDQTTTYIPLIFSQASSSAMRANVVIGAGFTIGILGILSVATSRTSWRKREH